MGFDIFDSPFWKDRLKPKVYKPKVTGFAVFDPPTPPDPNVVRTEQFAAIAPRPFRDTGKLLNPPPVQAKTTLQPPVTQGIRPMASAMPATTTRPSMPAGPQRWPVQVQSAAAARPPAPFPAVEGAQLDQGKLTFQPAGKPAVLGESKPSEAPPDERWASFPRTPIRHEELSKYGLQMSLFKDPQYGTFYLEFFGAPDKKLIDFVPGQWSKSRQAWIYSLGDRTKIPNPQQVAQQFISTAKAFESKSPGYQKAANLLQAPGQHFGVPAKTPIATGIPQAPVERTAPTLKPVHDIAKSFLQGVYDTVGLTPLVEKHMGDKPLSPEAAKYDPREILKPPEDPAFSDSAARFVGQIAPYIVAGNILAPIIPAASGAMAGKVTPKAAQTIAGVAGRGAVGATVSGFRETMKGLTSPNEFEVKQAALNVAEETSRFVAFALAASGLGAPVKTKILNALRDSMGKGVVTWNLANVIAAVGGSLPTASVMASLNTALNYMRNPEEFDKAQAKQDALSSFLFYVGMDVFFSLRHLASPRAWTKGAPGEMPKTPQPSKNAEPLAGFKNDLTGRGVFMSGTYDPAKDGYRELKGMGVWIKPGTGSQIQEMVKVGDWVIPKWDAVKSGIMGKPIADTPPVQPTPTPTPATPALLAGTVAPAPVPPAPKPPEPAKPPAPKAAKFPTITEGQQVTVAGREGTYTVIDAKAPGFIRVQTPEGGVMPVGRANVSVVEEKPATRPETLVAEAAENPIDQRKNLALRAEVDKLSTEEKDQVIKDLRQYHFTDEMTGLGNKAKYLTDEKKQYQAIIDLDNLKWVNDNIGHSAGDVLIKTFGEALSGVENAYRVSGDEFIVQGDSEKALRSALVDIEANMAAREIELAGDKKSFVKTGLDFSYGIGKTLDDAETVLQQHKQARLAEGKRVERGQTPKGVTEAPAIAKEPWQMTREEYIGDKAGVDAVAVAKSSHANHVKQAVQDGKPVPREVLEQYKNNGWAQIALEKMGAGAPAETKAPPFAPDLTYTERVKRDNDEVIKTLGLGRAGAAALRKETMATNHDLTTSDGRDLIHFFEKYYKAGRLGKSMPHVDIHHGKAGEFYNAGKKDLLPLPGETSRQKAVGLITEDTVAKIEREGFEITAGDMDNNTYYEVAGLVSGGPAGELRKAGLTVKKTPEEKITPAERPEAPGVKAKWDAMTREERVAFAKTFGWSNQRSESMAKLPWVNLSPAARKVMEEGKPLSGEAPAKETDDVANLLTRREEDVVNFQQAVESLTRRDTNFLNGRLAALEKLGIDTAAVREAIEEFTGIERKGLTPEDYVAEREAAWDSVIDAVADLDPGDADDVRGFYEAGKKDAVVPAAEAHKREIGEIVTIDGKEYRIVKFEKGKYTLSSVKPLGSYIKSPGVAQREGTDTRGGIHQGLYLTEDELTAKVSGEVPTAEKQKTNIGYHAGGLGKAEGLPRQYGSSRGTGHFGTGTYFVGNKENLNLGSYKDRPIHEVDFSEYNLFTPKSEAEGRDVHDFLKTVNNGRYELAQEEGISEDDIDAARLAEPDEAIAIYQRLGLWDDEAFQSATGMTTKKYIDEQVSSPEADRFLRKTFDDLKQKAEKIQRAKRNVEDSLDPAAKALGISSHDLESLAEGVIAEVEKEVSDQQIYELRDTDSASTRIMKALGYEGVDVRYLPNLDNTEYGSVIYELKTGKVEKPDAEKQAIAKPEEIEDTGIEKGKREEVEDSDRAEDRIPAAPEGRRGGARTLEGVSPEDVSGTGESRSAEQGGVHGPAADVRHGGDVAVSGVDASGSVEHGDEGVHLPSGRKDSPEPGERAGDVGSPRRGSRGVTGQNYRITQEEGIDTRSKLQKTKDNIEAIRLMKEIVAAGQPATAEEQEVLVKYSGWGFNPQVFDSSNKEYAELGAQLKEMLASDEYYAARESTQYAHYTPPGVINAMYDALKHLGFRGGNILEPAMGAGHFFGMMPEEMAKASRISGVEIDSITGNIAKLLYPRGDINVMGYQDFDVPYDKTKLRRENHFDLIISNVPFSNTKGFHDMRYAGAPGEASLHNYFFIKALDHLRPGGIMAFITSHYTMDAQDSKFRKYIAGNADLLGAVRMHNESMKGTAETAVTADIIFLQKREQGAEAKGAQWIKAEKQPDLKGLEGKSDWERSYYAPAVNEYFIENPHMVMGEQEVKKHGMYGRDEYTVTPTPETKDLYKAISKVIARLPKDAYVPPPKHEATEAATVDVLAPAPADSIPFSFFIKDGNVMSVQVSPAGELVLVPAEGLIPNFTRGGLVDKRIRGMIGLRDALTDLIRKELNDAPDIEASRKKLNTLYDAFVKKHGLVNDNKNNAAFGLDPGYFRVSGLEHWNKDKKKYEKAPIFRQRTISKYEPATKADTPKEALMLSLNERGRVDLEHISGLVSMDPAGVTKELAGLIFHDPQKGWVMEDEYLSGNVREKLRIAQDAAKHEPERYAGNVEALQSVQPKDLEPYEISSNLGAPWIPAPEVHQFISSLLQIHHSYLKVAFSPSTGVWDVQVSDRGKGSLSGSAKNTMDYGTQDMSAIKIIQKTLNSLEVVVYKTIEHPLDPEKTKKVPDQARTLAAKNKQKAILDEFKKWLWADEKRSDYLARKYNDEYNNLRLREFNGAHLTLPGMNPSTTLRSHQKRAVWRIVQGRPTLLHHWVGAGKTMEMVAGAMELKRLGIAKKPMMVAPNFLVGPHAKEAASLYPGAKILTFTKADLEAKNRKRLTAKIATGDWDLIVMPASSYGLLPMSADYVKEWIDRELMGLRRAIERAEMEGADKKTIKQIENAVARMQGKLEKYLKSIQRRQDQGHLSFEELGVDALFVDEAHLFKNLFFATRMSRVGSLGNPEGVQKAFDMLMKVDYIRSLRGGSGIVFASGTPISNSLAEAYIMQRYLAPEQLAEKGITTFDSWAKSFGEVISARELSPSGKGFRMKQRFAKIVNVPELITMYRQFADVLNRDQLAKILADVGITLPTMKTGKRQIMAAEVSPEITQYIDWLDERGEAIRNGVVDPSVDNFLKIVNEGRLVALYPPLVGLPDYHGSRVHLATKTIFDTWKRTKDGRMTQLVFLDLSVPKGKTKAQELTEAVADDDIESVTDETSDTMVATVYGIIRKNLISLGVPAGEIAFIHDYKDVKSREQLFEEMNAGDKRILLGSTGKMGVGMNVQKRVAALHHIDCPWKPAELTQREGRALRQGNMNEEVDVYTYVTKRTLDPFMWQTLERKQAIIARIESGDLSMRTMEDIDEDASQFGNIKAIATDNPLMLEHQEIGDRLLELSIEQQTFERDRLRAQKEIREHKKGIEKDEGFVSLAKKDLAARQDTRGDKFKITIAGKTYTERKDAGESLFGMAVYANKAYMDTDDINKASKAFDKKYGFPFQIEAYDTAWGSMTSVYIDVGNFAGLRVRMDPKHRTISLVGGVHYHGGAFESAAGTIKVLENLASSIEKKIEARQADIANSREEIGRYEAILEKKSDAADEIAKLMERKAWIEQEMGMDKNSVDAGGEGDDGVINEELVSEVDEILFRRIRKEERGFVVHRPEKTSIRQVASGLRRGVLAKLLLPNTVNLDLGGGRFDEGTNFLAQHDVENLVYDSYARPEAHNADILDRIQDDGGVNSVTLNNVLNVIPTDKERATVLTFMYDVLYPGGKALITVYEGDGTGKGRRRYLGDGTSTWQENRKLATYEQEIKKALPASAGIEKKAGMFVITKASPKTAKKEVAVKAEKETPFIPTKGKEAGRKTPVPVRPGEIIKRRETILKLFDILDTPLRTGKIRIKDALGVHKPFSNIVRMRGPVAESPRHTFHEAGHRLDQIFNYELTQDDTYDDELLAADYVKELLEEKPETPERELRKEGLAEFFMYFLKDPQKAIDNFPKFHEFFLNRLREQPDLYAALLDYRDLYQAYDAQDPVRKVLSAMDEPRKSRITFRRAVMKVTAGIFDNLHPVDVFAKIITGGKELSAEADPYLLARLTRGTAGRAYVLIHHGQYKWQGKGEKQEFVKVGPSLKEIADEAGADFPEFTAYLVAKRAQELEAVDLPKLQAEAEELGIDGLDSMKKTLEIWQKQKKTDTEAYREMVKKVSQLEALKTRIDMLTKLKERNITSGIDMEAAAEVVKMFDQNDKFKRLLKQWRQWWDYLIDDSIRAGTISVQSAQLMREMHQYYVPFKRVRDDDEHLFTGGGGKTLGDLPSPIKRIYGSGRSILKPWEQAARDAYFQMSVNDRNRAMLALADLGHEYEGMGRIIENVTPTMRVTRFSLAEIVGSLEDAGFEIEEGDLSIMAQVFDPARWGTPRLNTVVVLRDGRPEFWRLDKDLYRSIMGMDEETITMLEKIFRPFAQLLRAGATLNPRFISWNPWRDQFWTGSFAKEYKPFYDLGKGVASIAKKDDWYVAFMHSGAAMSALTTFDTYRKPTIKTFIDNKVKENIKQFAPLAWLRSGSATMEQGTKISLFKRKIEAGASPVGAAVVARDATVDYALRGSWTKLFRSIIPFFNAALQSQYRMVKGFKKDPAGTTIRALLYITLPTILLYLLNRKNPWYHELPWWRKDGSWNFPNPWGERDEEGNVKQFIPMPIPFVLGYLFKSFPERVMAAIDQDDPHAWDEFGANLGRMVSPNYIPTVFLPVIENWANLSSFTGKPIVPTRDLYVEPWLQYGPYTSEASKLLGRAWNVSPRKIDNYIFSYTAGLGRLGVKGVDKALEMIGLADKTPKAAEGAKGIPILGEFITEPGYGGTATIDRFYKDYNETQKLYNTLKRLYDSGKELPELNDRQIDLLSVWDEMKGLESELRKLRALVREVHIDTELTPEEKAKVIDRIQLQMLNYTRQAYGKAPIPE